MARTGFIGLLALIAISTTAQAQSPCPFLERDYLAYNPDVAWAVQQGTHRSGLEHYNIYGYLENRVINSRCAPQGKCPFSERDYLAYNPDVAVAVQGGYYRSGLHHYAVHGVNENRTVNRLCAEVTRPDTCTYSEHDYLAFNPDVAWAVQNGHYSSGQEHYVRHGVYEARVINALCNPERKCPFDERDYLAYNPDVARAVQGGYYRSGLHHYAVYGLHENRVTNRRCARRR